MIPDQYVAYYHTALRGINLSMQKAVVQYFAKSEKLELAHTFIDDSSTQTEFQKAVRYCLKNKIMLFIATIDVLHSNEYVIMAAKKKL